MGRGHRGGGARRSSGGGSGRGHRQSQPAAAPPSGEALRVELRATPQFYEALKGRECPATAAEGSSSAAPSPMGTSVLQMADWKDLGPLIGWFREGIKADPAAELAFSTKLTKSQRASVHGTTTAVTRGGLGTASRGVGEGRCVVVMATQRALRPELDERQDHQAYWTWKWAGQQGLQVSRDEVAEMILGGGLTPELQAIWDKQAAAQKAVQQLCAAVAAGDTAAAAALLESRPEVLSERVFDVQTGVAPLHLAAKEGQVPLLELLLSKGADPESLDGHGWTALQVARKFEQSDAEGVLLRAGVHDPDKGKSILEKKVDLPGGKPQAPAHAPVPAAPAAEGSAPLQANGTSEPAAAAAAQPALVSAPGSGPLSDAGSQDVYVDSVASVCGTERDNLAAEVGSNADDYLDPQYQAASSTAFSPVEEEAEAEDAAAAAAANSAAAAAVAAADSERAQAEAVELATKAAAEAEAGAAEAAAEEAAVAKAAAAAAVAKVTATEEEREAGKGKQAADLAGAEEEEEDEEEEDEEGSTGVDEEEEAVETAFAEAGLKALSAFNAAVAAAEAAEAAAEEADGMPGAEAAERAAAFRKESEAAVAAAAAAAVVAGEALDDVLTSHLSGTLPPQPPPSSAASVCGSDTRSQLPDVSEFGSGPLSSAGSVPAHAMAGQTRSPILNLPAPEQAKEEQPAAQEAAASAAAAVVASGTAAAAAGAQPSAAAEGQAPLQAAASAADDIKTVAASAAEQTAAAAKGTAAAASRAASQARSELEARAPQWGSWLEERAPEWKRWAQEHPGSVMVGAGISAAALAALLFSSRRR